MPRHTIDPDREHRIARAGAYLQEDHSYNEASRKFGLPVSTLTRRHPGLGWKTKRKAGPTQEQLAQARALFAENASRTEVHRTTGLSMFMLEKHFPDEKWTKSEASAYAKVRRMERSIKILPGTLSIEREET